MEYQTLLFEIKDGVALITINRPDKLNALNDQVMAELADVAERLATGDDIRGAILTGAGPKAFVAGGDIGDPAPQRPVAGTVPAAELLPEAEKLLRGILAMGPLAVRLALEAVDQGLEMSLDEGLLLEANHFGLLAATHDMKEGLGAFLAKRAPRFEGR